MIAGTDMHGTVSVVREGDRGHSWVVPPLDSTWGELARLRWLAATVNLSTGLAVGVTDADYTADGVRQDGFYSVTVGGTVTGPQSFGKAWDYLSGVETGAREAVRLVKRVAARLVALADLLDGEGDTDEKKALPLLRFLAQHLADTTGEDL